MSAWVCGLIVCIDTRIQVDSVAHDMSKVL